MSNEQSPIFKHQLISLLFLWDISPNGYSSPFPLPTSHLARILPTRRSPCFYHAIFMQSEYKNMYHVTSNNLLGSSRKINSLSERLTKPHRCHYSYFADPSYPSFPLSLYSPATLAFFIVFWHTDSITTAKTCINGFTSLEIWNPVWPLVFGQMSFSMCCLLRGPSLATQSSFTNTWSYFTYMQIRNCF